MIEDCLCGHGGHPATQTDVMGACPVAGCGCTKWRPVSSAMGRSMKREYVTSSVAFSSEGVEMSFMVLPDDVRSQAHVVSSRHASIAFAVGGPLGEAARAVQEAADRLAETFLAQVDKLPVYEPPATERQAYVPTPVDDDDDDVGMGDGR